MLKGKVTGVEFHARLDIDCKTAEIIAWAVSYGIDEWFASCTKQYSKEEITTALQELRQSCEAIKRTKATALKAMNKALSGEE